MKAIDVKSAVGGEGGPVVVLVAGIGPLGAAALTLSLRRASTMVAPERIA